MIFYHIISLYKIAFTYQKLFGMHILIVRVLLHAHSKPSTYLCTHVHPQCACAHSDMYILFITCIIILLLHLFPNNTYYIHSHQ